MGFSNGSFCKIKEVVEKQANYTVCKVTITKKNKLTNEYELQFSAHCRFVGNAHKSVPMKDQRIKITSCDVTNCYKDKDGNLQFTKNPQYVVFGYELQESQGASAPQFHNPYDNGVNFEDLSSNSDDLPFNLGLSLP
jgi:hypothetical protein